MKMPGNMQAMMQQAQKMQEKLQAEVALIRVDAQPHPDKVGMVGHEDVHRAK